MKIAASVAVLFLSASLSIPGQQPEGGENPNPPSPVVFEGKTLFSVHTPVSGVPPDERATAIAQRIYGVARNNSRPVESIRTLEIPGAGTLIVSGDTTLLSVSGEEAQAAGQPRDQLAAAIADSIRRAVAGYRDQWSARHLLIDVLYTLGAIVVFIFLLRLLAMAHSLARKKDHRLDHRKRKTAAFFRFRDPLATACGDSRPRCRRRAPLGRR